MVTHGLASVMAQYYTPALAELVTEYARTDLELFHYQVWNGDPSQPWA